jgi:hypothetical protein
VGSATTSLDGKVTSRVVDQDLPHGTGSDCKEVDAVVWGHTISFRKADVRFVNDCGRVEAAAGTASEMAPGHDAEFFVHDRKESIQRGAVALAKRGE